MSWLNIFNSSGSPAPEWQKYLEHFKMQPPLKTLVDEIDFLVLDLETTGLDSRKDRMLSLGAVQVRKLEIKVDQRLEYFVQQSNYIPNQSIGIHGILPEHSAAGIAEADLMKGLLRFMRADVIVGHHIRFDVSVLNQAIKRIYGKPLKNRVIDTVDLVRKWDRISSQPPHRDLSLDGVCQRWQIPLHERHTAAGDTLITAILFLKLVGSLQRKGIKTLGDLLRH